ncbi:MAG: hypothetical protein KAQ65_09365 [Candidatus Thorarchaeota archaeon]|nr:hypothetical protein [Candidatus Thorarchaeota archaeon]MCK5239298.1 hypothetical protein [Candidatus Thorarchaeota archaeon]
MSDVTTKKEFTDLNFQIWRVKDVQSGKWRDEIYIMGDDNALNTLSESLQALLNIFATYAKGTKKYKCNPPADFDTRAFGEENKVQIQWLDMLVVRLGFDAIDNEPFILDDFTVELSVNPATLKQFIERTQAYLASTEKYGHGAEAVCGLRFSPDWVGAE